MSKTKHFSLQDFLVRQIYALVQETADSMCPDDMDVLEFECMLFGVIAQNFAAKHEMAKALLAGEEARPSERKKQTKPAK